MIFNSMIVELVIIGGKIHTFWALQTVEGLNRHNLPWVIDIHSEKLENMFNLKSFIVRKKLISIIKSGVYFIYAVNQIVVNVIWHIFNRAKLKFFFEIKPPLSIAG